MNMKLLDHKFAKIKSITAEVKTLGGQIYIVGGSVRDAFIGKDSKDLDIVVTGIGLDSLLSILGRNGKIKEVGKSFGIIKFVPFGEKEEIDVALPRTEKKIDTGHKGFEITVDHLLPIEEDLKRRDFTINSIAYSSEGDLVDPFGGVFDLEYRVIRMTNSTAFGEDPLRMLRAIQFSSRFDFKIEKNTLNQISMNAHLIREITPERILIEFEKIVSKGSPLIGAELLFKTGLFYHIFESPVTRRFSTIGLFKKIKTLGEFMTLLFMSRNIEAIRIENGSDFFKNRMKGDIDTYKEIKALEIGLSNPIHHFFGSTQSRLMAFDIYNLSKRAFNSNLFDSVLEVAIEELRRGKFPKTLKELEINGNDLIELGFSGVKIGEILKKALLEIFKETIENKKEQLLEFAITFKK